MNKATEQLTREQAIQFADQEKYKSMSASEIEHFQINQKCLCMPFGVFHGAVEETLGRPVYTHEFANPDSLRNELLGKIPTPTLGEIICKLVK